MAETADWEAGVDILTQSLARIVQRPSYGATQIVDITGTAAPNITTRIMSIEGKGIILGAYVFITASATQQNSYIHTIIDGAHMHTPTFNELSTYNFSRGPSTIFVASLIDEVNFDYAGYCNLGTTFEASYYFEYAELHGNSPTVNLKLFYAAVE